MKAKIDWVSRETRRLKLLAPQTYTNTLITCPYLIDQVTNGCGSETMGVFYHLVPDTVYFMNINPVTHIHDYMYTYPLKFETVSEGLAWKRKSDFWFYLNAKIMIEDRGGLWAYFRRKRLASYCFALEAGGSESFWCNKLLPPDYFEYYLDAPEFDRRKYAKYKHILEEISSLLQNSDS